MFSEQTKIVQTALKLLAILAVSLLASVAVYWSLQPRGGLLFSNADFEAGSLKNWRPEGSAFESQPTLGDNPVKRGRAKPTAIQGRYWIGTYEKHPSAKAAEGSFQGDEATGRLTSIPFVIRKNKISFLAGAGNGSPATTISLVVEGRTVLTHSPNAFISSEETLARVTWDVSAWRGQKARLVLSDQAFSGWGHLNADDFRYA